MSPAAERAVRAGHPWIFAESIREASRPGNAGELAVIYDRQDRFLAVGLYDPDSPLRIRVLVAGKPENLDAQWWARRLAQAVARRTGLFDAQTTGHRWIYGESDGWPGLVLDRYGASLVLKLYTAAWLPRLQEITPIIAAQFQPERLVLRLSRNIQTTAEKQFSLRDGAVLLGQKDQDTVVFLENGLRFEAEIYRGQKTGFFLDQRENRRRVGELARGRKVLNAFSFSGGFSLYAARGGATAVTDVDISTHALESSRRNFGLNQDCPAVAACRHELVQADVFDYLAERAQPQFDLVILDPPSLAKREAERATALRAYGNLAAGGIRCLRRHGILVAASCSAHVSAEEFFGIVRQAAQRSSRKFKELQTTGHPPDHPATFPEAQYLKCIYLAFD